MWIWYGLRDFCVLVWCEFVVMLIRSAIFRYQLYGMFCHFTHWKHTNWFLTSSFIWRNEISWNLLWQLDLRFASQMIILIFSAIQNVFQCIFHSHRHKKKFSNPWTTGIMPFSIASQEKLKQVFPYKAFIDFVNCIFNVICVTSKDVILHVIQSLRIRRDKKTISMQQCDFVQDDCTQQSRHCLSA